MSKLDELISLYCLDGVPHKTLGELGKFFGGLTGKSKDDFTDGNAKFITYKNVYSNPALQIDVEDRVKIADGEKQRTLRYGDVVFTGSSETPDECGISSVVTVKTDEKLYLNSFCFFFRFNDLSIMLPDFAKHLFRSSDLRYQIGKTASGVTRFNVSKKLMEKVTIPLPPLEVQREIVRILDNFTELTTALTTALTTELEARKTQYEYYRDELLSFDGDISVKWMPLGDITSQIRNGFNYKADGDRSKRYKISRIETISSGTINIEKVGSCDSINESYLLQDGDILFSHINSLPYLGNTAYYSSKIGELYHGMNLLCFRCNPTVIIPRYLFYFLRGHKTRRYVERYAKRSCNQYSLTTSDIRKWEIPVPTLAEQEHIVAILDRFDALCNDLSSGLPAEIEARKKQYEYYRDKLLTFKELGA